MGAEPRWKIDEATVARWNEDNTQSDERASLGKYLGPLSITGERRVDEKSLSEGNGEQRFKGEKSVVDREGWRAQEEFMGFVNHGEWAVVAMNARFASNLHK